MPEPRSSDEEFDRETGTWRITLAVTADDPLVVGQIYEINSKSISANRVQVMNILKNNHPEYCLVVKPVFQG
jgi:hypothetical protein